jgi:hypothetical protein
VAGLYVVPKLEELVDDPKAREVLDADTKQIFEISIAASIPT